VKNFEYQMRIQMVNRKLRRGNFNIIQHVSLENGWLNIIIKTLKVLLRGKMTSKKLPSVNSHQMSDVFYLSGFTGSSV
jgi:hypothetical protein